MIPENREQAEHTQKKHEDCIQALEAYLRDEASWDAMQNEHVAEGMEKRLALKAKDWNLKYNAGFMEGDYTALAREAIRRYLDNWNGKVQGEDNRGRRLGKSWCPYL